MPYVLPPIFRSSTNCANALPVATVVRSFTTIGLGTLDPMPMALANMLGETIPCAQSLGDRLGDERCVAECR